MSSTSKRIIPDNAAVASTPDLSQLAEELSEPAAPQDRGAFVRSLQFRFRASYRLVWLALAVLIIVCALTGSATFHEVSLQVTTALAGVLAIAAAGQLLVIMGGGIDLSVPAIMTLAAGIVVKQTQGLDGSLLTAIVEALIVGGLIGLVNGAIIALFRLSALIVTLAMAGIITGGTLVWAGVTFSATGHVPPALSSLGGDSIGPVSVIGLVGVICLGLLAWAIQHTRVGWSFVAAGTNRVAADIVGIRVRRYEIGGYAAAGVLYAIAGVLLAGIVINPDYTLGTPYQLDTIIAVALGGASLAGGPGSVLCTSCACLFLTLLDQYLAVKGFTAGVNDVANGVVLLISVAVVSMAGGGRLRSFKPWHRRVISSGRKATARASGDE